MGGETAVETLNAQRCGTVSTNHAWCWPQTLGGPDAGCELHTRPSGEPDGAGGLDVELLRQVGDAHI